MGPNSSKDKRRRQNLSKREDLKVRKTKSYRRRQGIGVDEDEVELAGPFRRFAQYLIDLISISIFSIFFLGGLNIFVNIEKLPPGISVAPQLLIGLIYIVPSYVKTGQTFGCKKMSIVIIRHDGKGYINVLGATLRWLLLFIFPNFFVFLVPSDGTFTQSATASIIGFVLLVIVVLPAIVFKSRQGIHDRIAGSIVVRSWDVA